MEVTENMKNFQQFMESRVPGVKIISASKNNLNVQFSVHCETEIPIIFTMELNVSNGIPSIGRNDLPVFLLAAVVPRIRTYSIRESLQVILEILKAYMLRKMQVKELQEKYGTFVVGKVQFTLPCTYVEFVVHVRSKGEGMLCLGFHYDLLGTLPESIKAQWKVTKGSVKEIQGHFQEEIKVFLEMKLEEAFPLVFECNSK